MMFGEKDERGKGTCGENVEGETRKGWERDVWKKRRKRKRDVKEKGESGGEPECERRKGKVGRRKKDGE